MAMSLVPGWSTMDVHHRGGMSFQKIRLTSQTDTPVVQKGLFERLTPHRV